MDHCKKKASTNSVPSGGPSNEKIYKGGETQEKKKETAAY